MAYAGRRIALATLHGKERVLARPLRIGLGLELCHTRAVDTNQFGSFCGDQPRLDDAVLTAQRKAEAAMQALGLDLGLASEGSFGPHPRVPLLVAGVECLVVVDHRSERVVVEQAISARTNFAATSVASLEAAEAWLVAVGFPSHAVMVRPAESVFRSSSPWLAKGVSDPRRLSGLITAAVARSPRRLAWLETDMRAHCNPTRMASIRRLAFQLVRRLQCCCPLCQAPGFSLVGTIPGLPCSTCGLATDWARLELWGCDLCSHQQRRERRDGLRTVDPAYCPYCNP